MQGSLSRVAAPERALMTTWIDLFEQAENATVYLHPNVARRDGTWVYRRHARGELAALAVLEPRRLRVSRAPLLRRLGAFEAHRLIGDRVLGATDTGEALAFLIEVTERLDPREGQCLYLEDLEVGSPLWNAAMLLRDSGRVVVAPFPQPMQPHWWIRLPHRAEIYWQSFSSKSRRNLRREVRRLEHRVEVFRRPEDVPAFLARARVVADRSWQARRLGRRVHGSDQRDTLLRLARLGAFRSYILEHRGHDIAFVRGIQDGDRFVYDEIGHDADHAAVSPGAVLLCRVLEDLFARDTPRLFDFGAGDAAYKRRFGRHCTHSGPLIVFSPARRTNTLFALGRACRDGERAGRELLRHTPLYRTLRQRYRARGAAGDRT